LKLKLKWLEPKVEETSEIDRYLTKGFLILEKEDKTPNPELIVRKDEETSLYPTDSLQRTVETRYLKVSVPTEPLAAEIKTKLVDHHSLDGIPYQNYVKDEPEANEEGQEQKQQEVVKTKQSKPKASCCNTNWIRELVSTNKNRL
jgi:hypothetical protein